MTKLKTTISDAPPLAFNVIEQASDLPDGLSRDALAAFLHHTMKPWEDTLADILRAFDYCFSTAEGKGGFVLIAMQERELVGVVVFLRTGMEGYVPGHMLLFVSVKPALRGRGFGRKLIERGLARCDGPVKLHVEYDNPAKRLYEKVGFASKYAEMRYQP